MLMSFQNHANLIREFLCAFVYASSSLYKRVGRFYKTRIERHEGHLGYSVPYIPVPTTSMSTCKFFLFFDLNITKP